MELNGRRLTCVPIIKDGLVSAGADSVGVDVVGDGHLITAGVPSGFPAFCRTVIGALSE